MAYLGSRLRGNDDVAFRIAKANDSWLSEIITRGFRTAGEVCSI
jgi:hypothetical protein